MFFRTLLAVAALALFAGGIHARAQQPPARAQPADPFAGVWFLQSLNFSRRLEYTSTMAGTAIIQRDAPSHYSIHLIANQLDARVSDGTSWSTIADQRCQGVADGVQLTITCEIISVTTPQYGADSFAVQRTDDRTLAGVANGRAQIVFTRVD